MLSTNRISIKNEDLSASSIVTNSKVLGYTVVNAEKGPCKPVKVSAGNSEKIYSIFGYTSAEYPMIQEALDFNSGYDLYISAPYNTEGSSVGIAYVTDKGIFAAEPVKLGGAKIEDLGEDLNIDIPGITDKSSLSMKSTKFYQDVDFAVSGNVLTISRKDKSAGAFTFKADDVLYVKTGTKVREVKIVSKGSSLEAHSTIEHPTESSGMVKVGTVNNDTITFDATGVTTSDFFHASNIGKNLSASSFTYYGTGESFGEDTKVHAVIYQKYASNRVTTINYKNQTIPANKAITFTVSESITPTNTVTKSYTLSLDIAAKDGFGASLSYDSVLSDDPYIGIYVFDDDIAGATFENKGSQKLVGVRAKGNLNDGWDLITDSEYGDVDLFFNPEAYTEVNEEDTSHFFSLADSTPYPVQGFIFSCTPASVNESLSPLSFGPRYWNVCGQFTRVSSFTKEKYVSGLVGVRALMQAKIIEKSYGGVAPMFLNENGLGGQLGVSVRKALNNWDKDQIDILTEKNYNPIVKDPTYGLLLVGQKTCQAGDLSDWSYIGHVSSFINLEKILINSVLVPQIGKPNNDYYRDLRKTQVEAYLSPRISGSRAIWADAIVDTSTREGINDAAALAAREFRIVIKVQPNIYSEYVTLTLATYPQGVELS